MQLQWRRTLVQHINMQPNYLIKHRSSYKSVLLLVVFISIVTTRINAQSEKETLSTTQLISSVTDTTKKTASTNNTVGKKKLTKQKDTTLPFKKHDPRIATRRSALIPGWGQAYNKEYWKIPLVYGALSIPVITFFYNNKYYNKTKFAYEARYKAQLPVGQGRDSTDYFNIDPEIANLSLGSLQTYRNAFRRDRDYSVFWFLILWGVNVIDATVFGHLKNFDVSDDLSLHIQPTYNPASKVPGVGLTLSFKNATHKKSSLAR
jgi:Family of unknown function (DUF5683)